MKLREGVFADRLKDANAILEIITREGRTPAQGSLAWLWAKAGKPFLFQV